MKIAIVYDAAYPWIKGGAQRRFFEIGSRLSRSGWQVDWLTFQSWEGDPGITRNGIRFIGLARMPGMVTRAGKRNKSEPLLFFLQIVRHLRLLGNYQVIWAGQWPMLHLIPILLYCRVTGKTLIVDWWEVWDRHWLTYSRSVGWIGRLLEKMLLRRIARAGTIVTDCSLEESRIRAVTGDKARLYCLSNGIPADEIGEIDPAAQAEFDIGYLGRLRLHKRVDLIVQSIWHLREKHGIVASAAIIGDGPEHDGLQELTRELELVDQIRFFGNIPASHDCFEIMKKCSVSVVSTISGGGGNLTLLEAYGCGLPVLAFRCEEGIDPELIEHGRSGFLVEPVGGEPLADQLAVLLQDLDRILEMKRHVMSLSATYDWNRVAEGYSGIISMAVY